MSRKRARTQAVGHGWIGTLFGAAALAVVGFSGGLLAGLVMEEPELVLGHLWGRGVDVPLRLAAEEPVPATLPDEAPLGAVAAASRPQPEARPVSAPPPRLSAPHRPRSGSAAPRTGGYAIQVGAFRDSSQARSTVERLHARGVSAYVVEEPDAGIRYRVRVGPVATRAGAERLARELRDEHDLPTWIVRQGG